MSMKLALSIAIIFCSSLLGFIFSNTYVERTKLIKGLLSALQMLETEIVYGATPIPILLRKVGNKSKKEIGDIFLYVSNLLNKKQGETFEEVWYRSVNKKAKDTVLNKDDIEILLSLGKNLGVSDSEDQVKHIRLVREEFKRQYEISIIEESKNAKLYKNLGFLLGLAIVIMLY